MQHAKKLFSKLKFKRQRDRLRLLTTGFAMGTADLVPGVSGGTIAFLFGVYEELLYSIRTVSGVTLRHLLKGEFKAAIKSIPFGFLIPLLSGIVVAIFTLASLFTLLIEIFPVFLWSFFFGLVIGSAFIIGKQVKKWNGRAVAALVIGAIISFFVVGTAFSSGIGDGPLAFFVTGFIAFCAMILPGISGSLVMVLMGQYETVLQAVTDRNLGLLIFLAIGGALGLALFSRILGWVFRKYHAVATAFLIGMLIGSLRSLWPWREPGDTYSQDYLPPTFDWSFAGCLLLAVGGIVLVLRLEKLGIARQHTEDIKDKEFKKEQKEAQKT